MNTPKITEVQVSCRKLSEEQIRNMADIVAELGYKTGNLLMFNSYNHFRYSDDTSNFDIYNDWKDHQTISYEDFVRFYGTSDKERENTTENVLNGIKALLADKNKKYGNCALEPIEIFANKTTRGTRIDEKLAMVKHSTELRKNDIADLIGELVIVCKSKGWTDFSDLMD